MDINEAKAILENWWERWNQPGIDQGFGAYPPWMEQNIKALLEAQRIVTLAEAVAIVESMRWPKYESSGQGRMFGSNGWDQANYLAEKAHNQQVDQKIKALQSLSNKTKDV